MNVDSNGIQFELGACFSFYKEDEKTKKNSERKRKKKNNFYFH